MEEGKASEESKENKENEQETAMIEVKTKEKNKGSYFAGIIGAISGGLVAALPWLLTYIFTNNMVIPIFSALIPMGAFLGYKIFRGKKGKPFPVIITIISLLIIILVTMAICPTILMLKSGYPLTLDNLLGLYSDVRKEVRKTIIEDSIAGLVFTIIGIIITIKFFISKKQKETEQIEKEENKAKLKEQSQIIKNACLDLKSMEKETATSKKEIIKQLTIVYNIKRSKAKLYFINTLSNKLLKKYKGKYYYDETEEQEKIENVKKIKNRYISKITKFVIILVIAIIGVVVYFITNQKEHYLASENGSGIEIQVGSDQDYYGTYEDIKNEFGEEFAAYYDFIIMDKNKKYELYGMEIPNSNYQGKDFSTIMQEDRDYFAPYIGEEAVSQVEDKQFGNKHLKAYNYTYTGTNGNQYRAGIYLYEGETAYLWINIYSDLDIELQQLDEIVENLIK